ncbi:MAG: hypothetical protein GEV04_18130 [Actinophytocola sp.]|nr:hypothetical protein [Actinophytocola sp.]
MTGFAAILAPVLLLLSSIAYITGGGGINDGVLGGTVGVWSAIALAVASVGICRLAEPRAPRAAAVVQVVALAGFTAGVAFNVQGMYLGKYDLDLLTDLTGGASEGSEWIGAFAFLPWGWLAPLSFVLMGWLLWNTRAVAPWTAGLLALGGVLFVTGRPARIDTLVIATDVVLTIALVAIGLRLLGNQQNTIGQSASAAEPVPTKRGGRR